MLFLDLRILLRSTISDGPCEWSKPISSMTAVKIIAVALSETPVLSHICASFDIFIRLCNVLFRVQLDGDENTSEPEDELFFPVLQELTLGSPFSSAKHSPLFRCSTFSHFYLRDSLVVSFLSITPIIFRHYFRWFLRNGCYKIGTFWDFGQEHISKVLQLQKAKSKSILHSF